MTTIASSIAWAADGALDGFEAATLSFPDDEEGPVVATLVRRRATAPNGRAVLYIHGFNDYFFQAHAAAAFNEQGYDFYALDMRKYGRSLRDGQTPNYCRDLREYYAEIDAAIAIIAGPEERGWLLLSGHSTGGLLCALYAHDGAHRAQVKALFLNSPFFDLNLTPWRRSQAALACRIGARLPKLPLGGGLSPLYGESCHRDHRGEWAFNTDWKPLVGFPNYAGWLRAVVQGQERLQAGLRIACPVLVLHSARSIDPALTVWTDEFHSADAVLDVAHMRRFAPGLGRDVATVAIEGGMHDLTLSPPPVRARVFAELFGWLGRV
jgi:alpha-beta hydrolase superfamily lysophospholipase